MTWLYLPSNFFQGQGCLEKECELGSDLWASRIAPFVTLSGKVSPPASWQRACKKAAWMTHLFGPTLQPSTLTLGMGKWMESLRDSRVKTCQSPVAALASMENDPAFSSTYSISQTLAVRGSSFWRTSQASLLPPPPLWTKKKASSKNAQPPESWESWPTVGGMRSGSLFQRPMWAPVMAAHGGSASPGEWLTPNCPNGGRSVSAELVASKGMTEDGQKRTVGLESQSKHLATPNAHDGRRPGVDASSTQGANLNRDAAFWPTPSASIANDGESPETWHARAAKLKEKHGNGNGAGLPLTVATTQWPTPAARDFRSEQGGVKTMDHFNRPAGPSLPAFIAHSPFSPQAPATPDGPNCLADSPGSPQPSQTKKLNPYFVEWLMGWSAGWTSPTVQPDCAPEAMVSFRRALGRQLSCLFDGLESSDK